MNADDDAMKPPGHHGAQLDFSDDMSYGDYLQLDQLLAAQHPRSPAHDEMLFLVQHETSELWMKLMRHELAAAIARIAGDELAPAFKMLARVSRILEQLVHAWDVLATMTPPEYSAIRPSLGRSSGFQSWQYRCIEFRMGNKNAAMLAPHRHAPARLAEVEAAWRAPSLYDEALRLLVRRGLPVPASHVDRDWTQPYATSDAVEAAWLEVYRDPSRHWDLYQLGEELTDLEDAFRLWRFRHVTTVERIIGFKRGTGGTSGVGYLLWLFALRHLPPTRVTVFLALSPLTASAVGAADAACSAPVGVCVEASARSVAAARSPDDVDAGFEVSPSAGASACPPRPPPRSLPRSPPSRGAMTASASTKATPPPASSDHRRPPLCQATKNCRISAAASRNSTSAQPLCGLAQAAA